MASTIVHEPTTQVMTEEEKDVEAQKNDEEGNHAEDDIDDPGVAKIKKEFLIRRPKRTKPELKEESPNTPIIEPSIQNGVAGNNGTTSSNETTSSNGVENSDRSTSDVINGEDSSIKQEGSEKRKAESESEAPTKKMKGQFKNRPVDKSARDPSAKLCNRCERAIIIY